MSCCGWDSTHPGHEHCEICEQPLLGGSHYHCGQCRSTEVTSMYGHYSGGEFHCEERRARYEARN